MSDELSDSAPQESEAQRIGRLAGKAFGALIPDDWMPQPLEEHDFGFDYMVQIAVGAVVKNVFRVQLKGTRSPTLNVEGTLYSVTLEVSTVNYLARATEPVLLVLCVLADEVLQSKLFYVWIHEDLKRLRRIALKDNQQSVTLHVPVENHLDQHTSIAPYLERFRKLAQIGDELDMVVQTSHPSVADEVRAGLIAKLPEGLALRSPALIDAIAEPPTSAWVEAKEGSPQWHLREAAMAIRAGRTDAAERNLQRVLGVLTSLSSVEQADYWRQRGRLDFHRGNSARAREHFSRACELAPNTPRHVAAWAEAELRHSVERKDDSNLSQVLQRLAGSDPSILTMRARVLVGMGKSAEAIDVAESITGRERGSTLAIVLMAGRDLARALAVCEDHLSKPETLDDQRQALQIIRARAKFTLAVGGISDDEIPFSGLAGANLELLQEVWDDINTLVAEYRSNNWPMNVEIIADIWGLTSAMLGYREATIPVLAEAAAARPHATDLQQILEGMAATEGDFPGALEANLRLPPTATNLVRRVMLLHSAKRDLECVGVMEGKYGPLDSSDRKYSAALGMAIMSADRLFRTDLATQWTEKLESRSEWRVEATLLKFYRTVSQNLLERDAAVAELEASYHNQQRPLSLGAQLFYELNATKPEEATRVIELGKEITKTRMLDLDGCLHCAQAMGTLGKWDELLRYVDENIRRFQRNDRLQAVRALALDKLGRTGEAKAVLENLIAKAAPDPLALNTYIIISSRLGFNEQAISCLERVLSTATTKEARLRCLRGLFSLVHLNNPTSDRLLELAIGVGDLADQNDEAEEGLYLILMLTATMTRTFDVGDERVSLFQERLKAFCGRFPHSKVLKQASFPDNATGEEVLKTLRDLTGMSDEKLRQRLKTQNLVRRGEMAFPYAWRPRNVLDGVPDLPTLWELGKRSKSDEVHLQLQMAGPEWKPVPSSEIVEYVPLIDLVALLVLQDLELVDALFTLFKKIAISKATLRTIQSLLAPMSACPFRDKCIALQETLKQHFKQIEQPGAYGSEDEEDEASDIPHSDVLVLAKRGTYRLYSDDYVFRIGADLPDNAPTPMNTLDLLMALDELGYLSAQDVAKRLAKLCEWKVYIHVTLRHEIAVLPKGLDAARSISARIDLLRADPYASAMYDALWTIEKPLSTLQAHGGAVLKELVCEKRSNIDSIAAVAARWVMKAKFHREAPEREILLARIVVQTAVLIESMDPDLSRRLWTIYHAIVEHEYGDAMDESRYRSSIEALGRFAAFVDYNDSLTGERSLERRLGVGLTSGTSEYDRFMGAYASKKIDLAKARSSDTSRPQRSPTR